MAGLRISKDRYLWAIHHILKHGDTDIFPYPLEFEFLIASADSVADTLATLDLQNYRPLSMIESVFPKSKYGFRVAHQIYLIDAIIYLASVLEIAEDVENSRTTVPQKFQLNGVYSYRIKQTIEHDLFSKEYKFKDWLICLQVNTAFNNDEYTHVIVTDISDFYQRIYRHRLENCLTSYTQNARLVKFIEKCINDWRSRQSFGIPVGNNASRVLSEAALIDTDQAILGEGLDYTRYVDDIVIFTKTAQDPYTALAFLAEHLMVNEGLALNSQKTKIYTIQEYLQVVGERSGEDIEEAEDAGTELLFWAAYDADDVDEAALAELQARDLLPELEQEIAKDLWDIGKIRILLRAIKLTRSRAASNFLKDNFQTLLPFAKDVVLVIEELQKDGDTTFNDMSDIIVHMLLSDTLRSLSATRAWLFELFTRKVLPISRQQIRILSSLTGTLDKRYLILLRSINNDINYFRTNKTRINELSSWEQPAFISSARCLPQDEYRHWVRSIKTRLSFPLSEKFCEWCLTL